MDTTKIGITEQIKCASRELAMRKRCYPQWMAQGRITEADAKWEIDAMTEILNTLREIVDKDRLKLF